MADKTYMATLKKYLSKKTIQQYRQRCQECVRMLNGLEKTLDPKIRSRKTKRGIIYQTSLF